MLISVITVAYNAADTIGQTIDSVRTQTYPAIEHIVVDGASTDDTVAVVRAHADGRLTLISEPDRGIYDAMNKGIHLARGEIVCLLNADDHYIDPGVLERVAAAMAREGLDALFGDAAFFHAEQPKRLVRRYSSHHFRPGRIGWGWMPAHPALFLRRSVYERVGLFRTDYKIAGDFEFVARAFGKHSLRYRHLPEVLVQMRLGGVSTRGLRNKLLLNQEVLRACRENGIATNMLKILSKYPVKLLEYFQ